MSRYSKIKYTKDLLRDYLQSKGEIKDFGWEMWKEFANVDPKYDITYNTFKYFKIAEKDIKAYNKIKKDGTRSLNTVDLLAKYKLTKEEVVNKSKIYKKIWDKKNMQAQVNFVNKFKSEENIFEYIQNKFNTNFYE